MPDLGGFAAAHDLVGKSDVEVREAIGDKFPKHIYHRAPVKRDHVYGVNRSSQGHEAHPRRYRANG